MPSRVASNAAFAPQRGNVVASLSSTVNQRFYYSSPIYEYHFARKRCKRLRRHLVQASPSWGS